MATNEPLDEAELEGMRSEEGEDDHAGRPDPEGGGCMKLGWGCLPVIGAIVAIPQLIF